VLGHLCPDEVRFEADVYGKPKLNVSEEFGNCCDDDEKQT